MKREIKSVAMATLCCLMIFTSCAKTTRNVNNDEQVVSKELSTKDATGKDIPEWVKGSLGEGTLFEKVDMMVLVGLTMKCISLLVDSMTTALIIATALP